MVTFEIKVWEKDWRFILQANYLREIIKRCKYHFPERVVTINNNSSRTQIEKRLKCLIRKNIITAYNFVEDYETATLDFFKLNEKNFSGGYYYSIAELVALYRCTTPYLLHFAGDTFMSKQSDAWIEKSINILSAKKGLLVSNPSWDCDPQGVVSQAFVFEDEFAIGDRFSDQCFLVNTEKFKQINFSEKNNEIAQYYPTYGGDLFEKKVAEYMKNHLNYRATFLHSGYWHLNYPQPKKNWLLSKLQIKYVNKIRLLKK